MLRYNNIIINFILKNDMRNIKSFLIPILAIMVLIPMLSFSQGCVDASDDEGVNVFGFILHTILDSHILLM